MKKRIIALSLLLGLTSNMAFSTEVAFVDVQKVVESSATVQALKKEQEKKAKEMVAFVEKARKDVAAAKDEKRKVALEEKYNKELLAKKEKIEKDYTAKLKTIEDSISETIAAQAKTLGYDMVVAKSLVLYGANDITEQVIKAQNQPKTQTKSRSKSRSRR